MKITSRKREDEKPEGLRPDQLRHGIIYEAVKACTGQFWSYAALAGSTIVFFKASGLGYNEVKSGFDTFRYIPATSGTKIVIEA